MALINFILDLFGLLLWLNWLAVHLDPLAGGSANTLAGTLRKADPARPRRWGSLAGLLLLLLLRAWGEWLFSGGINWTPKLDLLFTTLPFRPDYFSHMVLFSALSFGQMLGAFYLWLLLLSAANGGAAEADPVQKLVRVLCRWIDAWPCWTKLLLPLAAGAVVWLALHPLLAWLGIVPATRSAGQLLAQAAVIGAGTYFAWKYLIVGVLMLHVLNSYVYFGEHPIWKFVNTTAQNLLRPLRWLPMRAGKVDLLPVAGMALVFLASEFFEHPASWPSAFGGLRQWYYQVLPF